MSPQARFAIMIAIFQIGTSSALQCFSCSGVRSYRDCTKLQQCGVHEACFARRTIDVNGDLFWDFGCQDSRQCASSPLVGKRASGDILICDQCCNTTLCQETLCGLTKDPNRGPICYNCDSQSTPTSCTTISECYGHQVCILTWASHGRLPYETGCHSRTSCDGAVAAFHATGTDKEPGFCFTCCDGDLCNNHCSNPADEPLQ